MQSDDKLQEITARGQRVQALLNDEDLKGCLAELQDELIEVMKRGKSLDDREQAHRLYLASEMLADRMLMTVNRGKQAEATLLERIKKSAASQVERVRRFATR